MAGTSGLPLNWLWNAPFRPKGLREICELAAGLSVRPVRVAWAGFNRSVQTLRNPVIERRRCHERLNEQTNSAGVGCCFQDVPPQFPWLAVGG